MLFKLSLVISIGWEWGRGDSDLPSCAPPVDRLTRSSKLAVLKKRRHHGVLDNQIDALDLTPEAVDVDVVPPPGVTAELVHSVDQKEISRVQLAAALIGEGSL